MDSAQLVYNIAANMCKVNEWRMLKLEIFWLYDDVYEAYLTTIEKQIVIRSDGTMDLIDR